MSKERIIILLLSISIIILFTIKKDNINEDQFGTLKETIHELSKSNKKLLDKNKAIEIELTAQKDSIVSLEQEIIEIEQKKFLLKKYYEKKINDINNLNINQLDSIFSSKYGR